MRTRVFVYSLNCVSRIRDTQFSVSYYTDLKILCYELRIDVQSSS